jgi:EmrB/QacA subfamily drug resistance transporter
LTNRPFAPPDDPHTHRAGDRQSCPADARPYVLAATIIASAMAFIDSSVVGIAVPAIQKSLSSDIVAMQWVANGYLLMLGALILVGGGLGDRVGRRRIFLIGIVAFTAASLLCALAPSAALLIGARMIQGIGAALLVPQSLAIISASFPRDVRGRAIGTWAAASAVTTSLGPPLGGFLIDLWSWRAAFWINLPLAVIALYLTWRFVPESRDEGAEGPIDWLGAALAVLAFGALTFGLSAISEGQVSALLIAAVIIVGLIGIVAYVVVEQRAANPITPPALFRSKIFTSVNIVTVFLYGALAGILFLLPFDLLNRRGYSAAMTGLIMLPFGLIIGLFSRFTGGLADTYGPRPFLVIGPLLVGAGSAGFALVIPDLWLGVVMPVVLVGFGMAILVSPLTTAVMNAVPEGKSGAASGISNAASRLAGVFAIAIFGATAGVIFSHGAPPSARFGIIPPAGAPTHDAIVSAFLPAYSAAMVFAGIWCVIAAVISFVTLKGTAPPKKKAGAGAAPAT